MKYFLTTTSLFLFGLIAKVSAAGLQNPLGDNVANLNPNIIIGKIIQTGLGLLGAVALVMFLKGGLDIFLSQGDMSKIKRGRNTIIWGAIGLVVIFASYALVSYVLAFIKTIGQ